MAFLHERPGNCRDSVEPAPPSGVIQLTLTEGVVMSVLSFLTAGVLIGLVYGFSFLPNATLANPEDF